MSVYGMMRSCVNVHVNRRVGKLKSGAQAGIEHSVYQTARCL